MQDLAVMNSEACDAVIAGLREHPIPEDNEDSSLPRIPPDLVPNFYFYLVGICHQTSPRNHPPVQGVVGGGHRRGWDYLYARLEQACSNNLELLRVDHWAEESAESHAELFTDDKYGMLLTGIPRRVELVRDMGNVLLRQGLDSITGIHERCCGHIHAHEPNLLDELARFQAYTDPVQKKSIFFLSIMRNSKLWEFPDDEQLEAPVDYHEIRGHLRLGTVQLADAQLESRVRQGVEVTQHEDIAIRMATRAALRYIADELSITPSRAHYLFWNLFRSICTRTSPECLSMRADNPLPERYMHLSKINGKDACCPFAAFCPSAQKHDRLVEHAIDTDYY